MGESCTQHTSWVTYCVINYYSSGYYTTSASSTTSPTTSMRANFLVGTFLTIANSSVCVSESCISLDHGTNWLFLQSCNAILCCETPSHERMKQRNAMRGMWWIEFCPPWRTHHQKIIFKKIKYLLLSPLHYFSLPYGSVLVRTQTK